MQLFYAFGKSYSYFFYLKSGKSEILNSFIIVIELNFLLLKRCPVGYHGIHCLEPCRSPGYGLSCQQICNCTDDLCNHITGCYQHGEGTTFPLSEHVLFSIIHMPINLFWKYAIYSNLT